MGKAKDILGAIGNAASNGITGGIQGGLTSMVSGLFGKKGMSQREAMEQQMKNDKELMDYQHVINEMTAKANQQRAKDMWWYTATNERKALEAQGLNPALMYNDSGSGGSASGAGTAEGVGLGSSNAVAMGLNAERQRAEIDAIKAQTAKTNAETEKTQGVDTEKTLSEIEFNKRNTEVLDSVEEMNLGNAEQAKEAVKLMQEQARLIKGQLEGINLDNYVKDKTKDLKVKELCRNISKMNSEITKNLQDAGVSRANQRLITKEVENYTWMMTIKQQEANAKTETAHAATKGANTARSALEVEKWATIYKGGIEKRAQDIMASLKKAGIQEQYTGQVTSIVKQLIASAAAVFCFAHGNAAGGMAALTVASTQGIPPEPMN